MAAVVDEKALDERLARLEAARAWSPRVVSRLEALVREGEDAALFRVNPFALAAERDLDPDEAVDLLLHARRARPVRDGLAPGLPALRLRGRELRPPARRPPPLPLPAVPQRLRGGHGRPGRGLLQRLAAGPRRPLPPPGDARPARPPARVPERARGAAAGREALPRRGARRRCAGWRSSSPGRPPASRSRPRRAPWRGSARTRTPASRCRSAAGRPRRRRSASGWATSARATGARGRAASWRRGRSRSRSRTRPRRAASSPCCRRRRGRGRTSCCASTPT